VYSSKDYLSVTHDDLNRTTGMSLSRIERDGMAEVEALAMTLLEDDDDEGVGTGAGEGEDDVADDDDDGGGGGSGGSIGNEAKHRTKHKSMKNTVTIGPHVLRHSQLTALLNEVGILRLQYAPNPPVVGSGGQTSAAAAATAAAAAESLVVKQIQQAAATLLNDDDRDGGRSEPGAGANNKPWSSEEVQEAILEATTLADEETLPMRILTDFIIHDEDGAFVRLEVLDSCRKAMKV
jgi:hypothetical protein